MLATLFVGPAQAEPGPCPKNCRPMDCELVYTEGDLAGGIMPTAEWRCYN